MTNDELEAVRARAEAAHPGPWTHGNPDTWIWGPSEKGGFTHVADIRGWGYLTGHGEGGLRLGEDEAFARQKATGAFIAHARTDIPALLDEVASERAQAEYNAAVVVAQTDSLLAAEARATRAEAHAEQLQAEATHWCSKHNQDRIALSLSEAHAERLAGALAGCLEQAEGCWLNHYGENPEGSPVPPHIDQARQALSAYRGEMKTVL